MPNFSEQAQEAARIARELEGKLGVKLEFNPADPADAERAIHEAEAEIDSTTQPYSHNPFIQILAQRLKEHVRRRVAETVEQHKQDKS